LREACLMDAVAASRVDADCPGMNQTLDQAQHRKRLRCFRHLAQPGEPALAVLPSVLRQFVQATALSRRQPIGQPTLDLSTRLVANIDAKALKCAGQRHDNSPLPAFLHHQPSEMSKPIVLNRMRQQPAGQFGSGTRAEGIQSEPILQVGGMTLSIALSGKVVVKGIRKNIDLLCDEREQRSWRSLARLQRTARITEITEHECLSELIMIATRAPDHREIRGGQRVMTHHLTLLGGRIEQRCDLGFGQLLASRHSCLPGLRCRQTSRPGPESR